ncbi:MAG: HAMP domain-containing histidine kinase [Clostridiales bacterium]|nr:HAMP domain-containing histidine kinase [Clostridiales bacterium]
MKWLITTLLKLSKLDAGTADFYIRSVNIKDVLNESIKPFLITIDLKNIKLVQEIEDFTFCADENWCSEAIGNIIKNCIEHTPEYGEIFIGANKTTIFNEIVISDNGTGISEKDLPHIFERFYQGNNASPESIGIGLALSKAIINKENGDISVESKLGEGTKFTIRFYETVV